jgi:hypothetical protein
MADKIHADGFEQQPAFVPGPHHQPADARRTLDLDRGRTSARSRSGELERAAAGC